MNPQGGTAKPAGRERIGASTPVDLNTGGRMPPLRREALRDGLQGAADLLHRRRASEIPDGYIDDYVSLNWMEWRGGGLRLTATGGNICRQVVVRTADDETVDLPVAVDSPVA